MPISLEALFDLVLKLGTPEQIQEVIKNALADKDYVAKFNGMMHHNATVAVRLARDAAAHTGCNVCAAGLDYCVGNKASKWLMGAEHNQLVTLASVLLIEHGRTLVKADADRIADRTGNDVEHEACC